MKARIFMSLILLYAVLVLEGCKKCLGVPVVNLLLGKWQLEEIQTPNKRVTVFDKTRYLQILPESGSVGQQSYIKETWLEDEQEVAIKEWVKSEDECKKRTTTVTYSNNLKRVFKLTYITGDPRKMEVTDFLLNDNAVDTVRYYYSQLPD